MTGPAAMTAKGVADPGGHAGHRIEWLDGWRTVAVMIVIASHWSRLHMDDPPIPGTLGVFLFFGISGFIVTKLLLREQLRTGGIDFRAFYLRRACRILPPLLIYVAIVVALGWQVPGVGTEAARAVLFTCNMNLPGVQPCGWTFAHTWSLAFEEQFYLLLPALLIFPALWHHRLLLAVALGMAALPFLLPIHYVGRIGFLQIYMLLGGGALLAWREHRVMALLARVPWPIGLGLLAAATACLMLPPSAAQKALGLLVPAAILIGMFSLPVSSALARRILSSGPMRTLGLYSYTLYLWQQLALSEGEWSNAWTQSLAMLAAVVFSALSYRFIEMPFRDLGRRLSTPTAPAASRKPAAG